MNVRFTHPQWLWLLPAALAWVVWLAKSSDVQTGRIRRWLASGVRLAVSAVLILALAGLESLTPIEGMNVFFALDRSDSVPAPQQELAREWIRQVANDKAPPDRAGVVVFGSEATIESSPKPALELQKIEAVVPAARTDIGAAIRLAAAAFPEFGQRRLVLLSDGNENLGDALGAAASARALGVNVDVVPLGGEKAVDASIQRLQLPPNLKQGQTFEVKVFVQADQPGPATLRLYRNEQYLGEQPVQLAAGKNLFTFQQALPAGGFYTYDVRMDAANDRVPENNRAFAFTQVRGVPRVLIVSSDPAADAPLAAALQSPDLAVKLTGTDGFPGSLAELQSYDALVLCNVLAAELPRSQQDLLESAVRDFGVGFVCVGGDQAYAAGAYRGTPLARILPVEVELSSQKVLPPGALVLVIDKSGSMTGEKLELAKQGAMGAVEALGDNDYVGVVAFDMEPHLVADVQRAANRKEILRRIAGIDAAGGTRLYPPMARAHALLNHVSASFKHCIVLTDGRSVPGDFPGITQAMADDRITISTVAVGPDADAPLLDAIASQGGGRFYFVPEPAQLPQIFIKEAAVVLKSAIREESFVPQLASATEPVRGIGAYPPLLGYVITEPKPRAETPLVTDQGDPLLAHWQYGLGRAVAFTSDARAKWAKHWIGWGHYQQFWRQVVQWSLRRLESSDFAVDVTTDRGAGRVSVEALDAQGNFRNFLDLQGFVVAPQGTRQTVRLRQTGPGHYEAAFPLREPGAYLLNLQQIENGQVRAAQAVGASLNYSPELDAPGPNLNLLRGIAEATGGKVLDPSRPGSNPFYDDRRTTWQPHALWEALLKLAIVLFVLDVGIRRLDPDPQEIEKLWRAAVSGILFWRQAPTAPASAGPSLPALLARRDEVRQQRSAPAVHSLAAPLPAGAQPIRTPAPGTSPAAESFPSQADEELKAPSGSGGRRAATTDRLLEAKRRAASPRKG